MCPKKTIAFSPLAWSRFTLVFAFYIKSTVAILRETPQLVSLVQHKKSYSYDHVSCSNSHVVIYMAY